MTHPDVIIIGGGIVGSAAAYECARAGLRTLLLDRNDQGRATNAGAGIITLLSGRYELGRPGPISPWPPGNTTRR